MYIYIHTVILETLKFRIIDERKKERKKNKQARMVVYINIISNCNDDQSLF